MRSEVRNSVRIPDILSLRTGRSIPASLLLLLASSGILLVAWSFVVPVFEAPDEPHHWQYARYLHDHGRVPLYDATMIEANQPPLYYWMIAPVSAKTEFPKPLAWFDGTGVLRAACPPRFYKTCPSDLRKYWPVRRARLVTVVFSIVTVLFTYLAGWEATGSCRTATLAGAFAAFLPQFTFRGTNVSNDALLATTSAAATYLIIRLLRRGFSWSTACVASLCVALAFLSKISAMIFVPALAGVLLSERTSWPHKLKRLSVFLLAAVCVLPWITRNLRLYGDPLASRVMASVIPIIVDRKSIWSRYFITTFPTNLMKSFIGVFGWMNVYLPSWIYYFFGFLVLLAIVGCVLAIARRKLDKRLALVLGALCILAILSTAQLNLTFSQPQGRYLFTALTAFMVLSAIGLDFLGAWRHSFHYLLLVLLAVINVYALFGVEWRTYWILRPAPIFTSVDVVTSPNLMSGPAGPLPREGRFGQTFVATRPNLSAVEIVLATYLRKIPSGFVNIHLRTSPRDSRDIASASIPASTVVDNNFVRLSFAPINDSTGKPYYVFIDTNGVPPGYLLTVYVSKSDIYPGGQFFIDDKPTDRDMLFRTLDTEGGAACAECN